MIPIKPVDDSSFPLHPPEDWDQEKGSCETLHVVPIKFAGQISLASLWKPSPDEIKEIIEGKPIMLIACGMSHPPVALAVANQLDRVLED